MADNIHLSRFQPNSDKSGFIGTSQYSWAEGYFYRGRFKEYAIFDQNITLGRMPDNTALNTLLTDKLYNVQGVLYWGENAVLTGTETEFSERQSENRLLNWAAIKEAPLYDTTNAQDDSGKYLKVEGNNLIWHKPLVTWTDVGGPAFSSAQIGKVLSVNSAGLFWDNKFDLATLPVFGSSDSVALDDMIGVVDVSSSSNKKVSVKSLIEKYHIEKAAEQEETADTVVGSDGQEVANPKKQIHSEIEWQDLDGDGTKETPVYNETTPVTAENLDALISPDSGLEILETCYNSGYQEVDCEINGNVNPEVQYKTKQLSIAKSDNAKNYYAIVSSNSSAYSLAAGEYNWTNRSIIDFKVDYTALGGSTAGRKSITIGKTYNNEFNNVRAALRSLQNDVPAGGNAYVLIKGDVAHTDSFGVYGGIEDLTIIDYNFFCMMLELNASGGHGDKIWRSGYSYVAGNCVYNKDYDNQSGPEDHEVYRCIRSHTSSTRPNADLSNWVRLTPHNSHLAFSVDSTGLWLINSVQGNGTSIRLDPFGVDSPWNAGSLWSKQYSSERFNHNRSWGGLNATNRCVVRCTMPVSDDPYYYNAFHCWISVEKILNIIGIKFVLTLGSKTNGEGYQAGFLRFGGVTPFECNINYVDVHYKALPESNRHKEAFSAFELVGDCWVRVFDSTWGATIHDPYNTGKRKHGMAFYCDDNVYFFTIFDIEDGWLMLGNEYWAHMQKDGLHDNSRFHWGSSFKAPVIFKVYNASKFETGNAAFSYANITFSNTRGLADGSGQTNGHMNSGSFYDSLLKSASTSANGIGSFSSTHVGTAWNASSNTIISVWADQFAQISIGESFTMMPGQNVKLASRDYFVSYPDIGRIGPPQSSFNSSNNNWYREPGDSSDS